METNGNGHGNPGTALAVYSPAGALAAYEPRSLDDAIRLAKIYAASGLSKFKAPEQALLAMATGAELGIPATTALRAIDVVEGKAALSADLMVALCLRRTDICEKFELLESTAKIATYEVQRRGRKAQRYPFTIEEAATAGLAGKDNWKKYPADMLRHRAAGRAARAEFPDITLGLVTPDEAREIQEAVPVLPAETSPLSPAMEDADIVESAEDKVARWERSIEAAGNVAAVDLVAEQIIADFGGKGSVPKDLQRRAVAKRKALEA